MEKKICREIRDALFSMRDEEYRIFQQKLIPTVASETVIGVRIPLLRAYAKQLSRRGDIGDFLESLPHGFYDENNLHGYLLEAIREYDRCIAALDAFLPYVDNWATCDTLSPRCLGTDKQRLAGDIRRWLASEHPYTKRFGLGMVQRYFLQEEPAELTGWLDAAADLCCEDYYVNMMIAWLFATALAKRFDETLPYLTGNRLSTFCRNKALTKACESRRLSAEQKGLLRTL